MQSSPPAKSTKPSTSSPKARLRLQFNPRPARRARVRTPKIRHPKIRRPKTNARLHRQLREGSDKLVEAAVAAVAGDAAVAGASRQLHRLLLRPQ